MPQIDALRVTSDAAFMADFRKSQARDVLNHYLEIMCSEYEGKVINFRPETSHREDDYHRGILAGLKMAQDIPENILAWAKQIAGEGPKPKKLGELTLA